MTTKHSSAARPQFRDNFARFRNVIGNRRKDADLERAVKGLASTATKGLKEGGLVKICIGTGRGEKVLMLDVNKNGIQPIKTTSYTPRLEVIVAKATAKKILAGEMSPVAAIAGRHMGFRGDLRFARSVYELLAADRRRTNLCP